MAVKVTSLVLIGIVAAVQASNLGRTGWSPPPPPPPPPTTTPAPPGWAPPPPPHSNIGVSLSGALAAEGGGWAAENHAENINVSGGWGLPANLDVAAGGESVIYQDGNTVQASTVDADTAASLNTVSVSQGASADEGLAVAAEGQQILVGQSGWSGAAAEGASAAAGGSSIIVS